MHDPVVSVFSWTCCAINAGLFLKLVMTWNTFSMTLILASRCQLYALSGAAAGLSFDFPQEWLTPQSSPAQRTGHPKAAMGINHSVWFCHLSAILAMPFCLFIVLVSVNLDEGFVQVGKFRVLELASQYQYTHHKFLSINCTLLNHWYSPALGWLVDTAGARSGGRTPGRRCGILEHVLFA